AGVRGGERPDRAAYITSPGTAPQSSETGRARGGAPAASRSGPPRCTHPRSARGARPSAPAAPLGPGLLRSRKHLPGRGGPEADPARTAAREPCRGGVPIVIGYVLKMYPRFSETFILAEILELERLGGKLRLISLKKPDDGRFHEDVASVQATVRYLPERFPGHPLIFLRAHFRALVHHFWTYLGVLMLTIRCLPGSWKGFLR